MHVRRRVVVERVVQGASLAHLLVWIGAFSLLRLFLVELDLDNLYHLFQFHTGAELIFNAACFARPLPGCHFFMASVVVSMLVWVRAHPRPWVRRALVVLSVAAIVALVLGVVCIGWASLDFATRL